MGNHPETNIAKKRILTVDDDDSVRQSLKKVLEDTGYEVVAAPGGVEGEATLQQEKFDLLILDLNMPNRDGWDVLGYASANHPMLPVIIITGMFDQLETTMIPGVSALLKKPIDVLPLLKTIETLLAESLEDRLNRVSRCAPVESGMRVNR